MADKHQPKPLQVDHITPSLEILELVERLAENAHEIWAHQRISEGWVYGMVRCDRTRRHPCLVPYSLLPESEKNYDRNAVLETMRAVLALGFVVTKSPLG
jgi:hypothetical protein